MQDLLNAFKKREKLWFSVIVSKTGVDASEIEDGDLNKLFQVCFDRQGLVGLGSDNLGITKHAVQ